MTHHIQCPRCMAALTDAELLSMRQMWASRQRKTKSGGKNGGRKRVDPSTGITLRLDASAFEVAEYAGVAQLHPKEEDNPPVRETQERSLAPIEDL